MARQRKLNYYYGHDGTDTSTIPLYRWFQFLQEQETQNIGCVLTVLFSLLVRWCVSLHGYSGFSKPPMYGDYEAQRHWMEVTNHLPPSQWYFYDLEYWGLDYPPLSAFQSWICGYVANLIDPNWVALGESRGIETHHSKLFMRSTVIGLELLIYLPAVLLWVKCSPSPTKAWIDKQVALFLILLHPCLLLIDHGHFQYNNVMLGFLVWSAYFASCQRYVLMAISFCCSLLFKQMSLYFAPAIFFFLLARCFGSGKGLKLFIQLGIVVTATTCLGLSPWIRSPNQLQQILIRVFPVWRGLYEDKVANVWCVANVVIKLRSRFDMQTLLRMSTLATCVGFLPSCIHLFVNVRRSQASHQQYSKILCYGLLNTSLSFFLFSFQVHEKSILLPLMPALMLLIHEERQAVSWFVQIALFSMYPLLFKDDLQLPYWVMAVGWCLLCGFPTCPASESNTSSFVIFLQWLSTMAMMAIHAADIYISPPAHLPDIYVVLNVMFSCGMFGLFMIYFNYQQLKISISSDVDALETKQKTE